MPRWKAVYVSVNKAACTALKWLVADVQEESRERFHRSLSREVSRTMTIHRRSLWQNTPMAKWMTDEELDAISATDGWFVFGVVRHPTARLFSAWQSKLLLREPWWWVDEYGEEAWFPRVPADGDEVVEDFVRFVRAIAQNPEQRVFRNRHFAPQHGLLAVDRMDYTRIYKTAEIPAAAGGLRAPPARAGLGGRAADTGASERDAAEADPVAVHARGARGRERALPRGLRGVRLRRPAARRPRPGRRATTRPRSPRSAGWSSAPSASTTSPCRRRSSRPRCARRRRKRRRTRSASRARRRPRPPNGRVRTLAWRVKRRLVSG